MNDLLFAVILLCIHTIATILIESAEKRSKKK